MDGGKGSMLNDGGRASRTGDLVEHVLRHCSSGVLVGIVSYTS